MSLYTTSLNSGSNGNCYYIGNEQEAVLVDAGLSCRETEKRMRQSGLDINRVKAIFISHEHGDHISGLEVLSARYELPVYITGETLRSGKLRLKESLIHSFDPFTPLNIGKLQVIPFPKEHDAADPYSFVVSGNGINIGVFTDIGISCKNLVHHFSQCHAAFLEANYDELLLENGRYPKHLKERIRGGSGHLSNRQALEVFNSHRPSYMTHLFLAHLSKENNSPELALQSFQTSAAGVEVIIASRYEALPVYKIAGPYQEIGSIAPPKKALKPVQLNLFG